MGQTGEFAASSLIVRQAARITIRVTEDIQAAKANDKLKTVFQAHKEHF